MRRTRLLPAVVPLLSVALLAGCGGSSDSAAPGPSPAPATGSSAPAPAPSSVSTPTISPTQPSSTPKPKPPAPKPPAPKPPKPKRPWVLAISVDGLNPDAVTQLGAGGAPAFYRLIDEGAGTLDARTEVEQTVTLPNHTGMLTGRRIDAAQGGHGVTWNDEIPGRIVPGPSGSGVDSVFTVVHAAGGGTALYAGKDKFATFQRSWPGAIDSFDVSTDTQGLVDETIGSLEDKRWFTFLHIALPDAAGHESGWMSPAYVSSVATTDQLIGEILTAIDGSKKLTRRTVVILTADHGGPPGEKDHGDASAYVDYRIPFLVWGSGIAPADLYHLNPDYADPGKDQLSYDGKQPVRNGDVANLALDLLGLKSVPGSELDARQDLDVTR